MTEWVTMTDPLVAIPRSERSRRGERGSALLLGPAAIAFGAVVLAGTVRLGTVVTDRARSDAVADLTALAAVTGGRPSAEAVAGANGARVVALGSDGSARTVVVESGGVRARATAAPVGGAGG